AGVDRLPEAAVHRARIEIVRPTRYAGHGIGAPAAEGAEEPPLESREERRQITRRCGEGRRRVPQRVRRLTHHVAYGRWRAGKQGERATEQAGTHEEVA